MTLEKLADALDKSGLQFAHHAWSHAPEGDYGTWAEDSGYDLMVDDRHLERGTVGYINYFTRDDSPTPRNTIEGILNDLVIPWNLNTVQYENDTGYIHYEWEFGCYG